MKIKDVVSDLKEGKICQYYLIAGTEAFLRELALKNILSNLQIQMEEWNVSLVRDGVELTVNLDGLPLMSERRAVICNIADIPDENRGQLAAYLPGMPQSTVFILIKEGSADKKKPIEKIFFEKGAVIDCAAPSESESIDFLCAYAAKHALKLSRRDAAALSRYVAGDLSSLISELEKLIALSEGEILKKDIEKYTIHSTTYNIFKLHDLLLNKRWTDARALLDEILDDDAMPIGLISILSSNFELMLIARACLDAGFSEAKTKKSIMESAKAAEFRAKKAIGQSAFMDAQKIRGATRKLSGLDFDAKQGNVILKNDLFPILMDIYSDGTSQ